VPAPDPAREEADRAAAEAARIGGSPSAEPPPDEPIDEAHRPLVEAGEGEAEGFEEAERQLIEHASHGDPAPDPTLLAAEENEEGREVSIEYGDADHFESSEREGLDEQ
jgi:hypothetical protein